MLSDYTHKATVVEKDARPSKKVKATGKPASENRKPVADTKKARKRAADLIEEDVEEPKAKPAKETKVKKVRIAEVEKEEPTPKSISKAKTKTKGSDKMKSRKPEKETPKEIVVAEKDVITLPASDDEEEDVAALLAGFSSDEDEPEDGEGLALEDIPQPKLDKKAKKALADAKKSGKDTPGTIYLGYGLPLSLHEYVL